MPLRTRDLVVHPDNDGTQRQAEHAAERRVDEPCQRAFVQADLFGGVNVETVDDDLAADPQHGGGSDGR